jgi:hypothetical protein
MKKTKQGIRDLDAEFGRSKKNPPKELPENDRPVIEDEDGNIRCKKCFRFEEDCVC